MPRLVTITIAVALAVLATSGAASAAESAVVVNAGGGASLRIERDPFRVALVDADGREVVATAAGAEGLPVRAPGLDGPQPLEPLGALGGFPALAFVIGARDGVTFPVSFFTGNRLFGAEVGALAAVTRVRSAHPVVDGADLELDLNTGGTPATLAVRRLPGGGVTLRLRPPPGLPAVSTMFSLASPADEGLYGLGGRKDAFDQRGLLRNVWVEQQNASMEQADPLVGTYTFPNGAQAAYSVQALLFGSRGWAAWAGGTALQRLDLAASRADRVRWGVASPGVELSLAAGGIEGAARAFTAATGRAPAPPRYVYEPWIDVINEGEGEAAPNGAGFTGGARVKSDLDGIVARSRELQIPIGVLGVEGWQSVLDREGPQARAYFQGLRAQGFRLAAYWNPFVAPAGLGYESALRRGLFVRTPLGDPYPIVTNRGNASYLIDFSHPDAAAWWKEQVDRSADLGFEAFMEDFGELVTEGMVFHDGSPPELAHNAYPVLYHAAGRAAIDAQARERPGFEPWFYVRSGFNGVTGSTSGVFPGDETTDWSVGSGLPSVVPAMLNHALGGTFTYTTDVGGYLDLVAPRTTPELLTRWLQLAAFTPVSRIHNSTGKGTLLPWDAGAEALDAYRRYARAKVRLIDLVDRWSRRAAGAGTIGPVRPLLLLDDPSPAARSVGDEWLLGRDILVAPILRRGATSRRVYLPAGATWERVTVGADGAWAPTGDVQEGGQTVTAPAPLADIPIYLRRVKVRAAIRCARGDRIRIVLAGDTDSVLRAMARTGRRRPARLRGGRPRGTLRPPARARRVRVRAVLEDGRVLRIARSLPRCVR